MLNDRLRQAGLKTTRPRLLVLNLLQELGGHRSIDDLIRGLKARGTPLPRASVYNVIAILVNRGLVMLADAGPGPALYEINLAWHHHFVCIECGMVVDIPCVKGEKPCLLPDWVPGVVEETQIIFRGRCTQCLAKTEQLGSYVQEGD
jgi:Fur family ferric uptake transcriptional regulator